MLKVRVIPTLLWKGVGLVKGVSFDSWRRIGTLMPALKVYNTREVDELALLDITATEEGREPDYSGVAELAAECFVPLTVGGGVRSLDHIRNLLLSGADKVLINTAAYENPDLIRQAAARFGSQCIVAGIDARRIVGRGHVCFSRCGTKDTSKEAGSWAEQVEASGAGEILVTSVERDGTMNGYDLDLIKAVTEHVRIPVIASGGAGNYEHLWEAIALSKASAVAAASIFHFTQATPLEAKQYLAGKGVAVRNVNAGRDALPAR